MFYVPHDAAAFWTAVAAIASTVAVLITCLSTYLVWQTLRSQNDPKVIVYMKHDSNRSTLLVLVIENIGRDVALRVRFKTSQPIPTEAWGLPSPKGAPTVLGTPFDGGDGIQALGPGDPRMYTLGQIGGLRAALPKPIRIDYTYGRSGRWRKFKGKAFIEVDSLGRLDISEPPLLRIAENSEKLVDVTDRIARGIRAMAEVAERRQGAGATCATPDEPTPQVPSARPRS